MTKAILKSKLPELEQQALQAMMDPHFIFNVINSIQYFINAGDKIAANRYLADFAKLIRISSGFAGKSLVTLEQELSYLQLYLSFEKLRFGENLTFEINVNPDIDIPKISIPVMMIQPFLENAIWHGILPMKAKGRLVLKIEPESDTLKIRVEDNGVGIEESYLEKNLLGLSHDIKIPGVAIQRLRYLKESNEQELYLRYKHMDPDQENKGTIVEFLLPGIFNS